MTLHRDVPTTRNTWGENVIHLAIGDFEIFRVMHTVRDAKNLPGSHLVPRFPWKLATLRQYE